MESNDLRALSELYLKTVYEQKSESPEKEEEKMKKDDDLAGSPNKKKNGKKADKDYDGDGKVESSKDEYFGSKDKAIKKAMGKDVKEARWWDVDVNEAVYGGKKEEKKDDRMVVTNADKKANTPAYQKFKAGSKSYKAADHMKEGHSTDTKGKKNCGCGQDPCVTYGKQDKKSMEEGYGKGKKKKKGHDCASKVKHEEYGMGECIKEMHDLDENGNVAHYDVLFGHGVEKQVPVASLQIIEQRMHEHVIHTEQKKAAKDYDGDGKVESGKDEYFGSRDKAIKKAMGKKSPETIEASRRKKDKLFGSPKNESFSSWRNDLREIVSATPMTDVESEKEVTEKKGIKNKVIINPKMSEAVAEIGGELISEKEVDVKDTRRTVDAIRAYDLSLIHI